MVVLIIRRLRCCECEKIHHELPDILVPYKRYGNESFEVVVSGDNNHSVAADESTIYRLRSWFDSLEKPKSLDALNEFFRVWLEEVRFLLNFKMDAQSPMSLILVGQSELWERFQLQAYAAIRQRIDIQCKLPQMDRSQVGEYIKKHLAYAGTEHDIFSSAAIDEIFRHSSGAARVVNKVCTHCLLYGAQNGRRIIDDHMVKFIIQGELS